jgi:uncharacterized protein (TIGR00251 family)
MTSPVVATKTGVQLRLQIQPKAARTELVGLHGDALRLRIAAPPVDGAANQAVIEFLADRIGVPRRSIRIVGGATSRRKRLEIDGITVAAARLALGMGTA